jgi:serine/arginine repetitive matrix protein 2
MEDEDWDRMDDSVSDLDFHSPRSQRSVSGGTDNSSTLRAKRANHGQPEKSPYLKFQNNLPSEPFTPRRGPPGPETSQSSIWEGTWPRGTKLSNVEEIAEGSTPVKRGPTKQPSRVFRISPSPSLKPDLSNAKQSQQHPPTRTNSKRLSGGPLVQRGGKTGSVRSTPPHWIEHAEGLPDPKLAMTPENIKPLLDSAREVLLRCTECVAEARTLLKMLENMRG